MLLLAACCIRSASRVRIPSIPGIGEIHSKKSRKIRLYRASDTLYRPVVREGAYTPRKADELGLVLCFVRILSIQSPRC